MLCAISGEQPEVPVASRKSGNIFEKRLIETYLSENETDPVNGEPLTQDDLIELKTTRTVRPRPPTLTSIPALLATFQNEWDAIALETYTLKQQLAQTRQELSTALYEYDAALRVIAKIQGERDEAREALSKVTVGGVSAAGDAMDVDSQALPDDLVARVEETQQNLSNTRRKRPVPDDWATGEEISTLDTILNTESLYPGANAIALDKAGSTALVGGTDGALGVYSIQEKKVVYELKSCGGAVTTAIWLDSKPVIATSTGSIKVFEGVTTNSKAIEVGSHAGKATTLALHPSGDILASAGVDKTYKLYDTNTMKLAAQVLTPSGITCGEFHPDGHLFAAGGEDGKIRLYDVKSGEEAAAFDAQGAVQALSFSENGTWLASIARGQTGASVWDLRKTAIIKVLDVGSPALAVQWDYSGQFLAVAGQGCVAVEQYSKSSKKWSEPLKKAISASSLAWGVRAKSLVVLTDQGALNILGS